MLYEEIIHNNMSRQSRHYTAYKRLPHIRTHKHNILITNTL